jgi:methylated-DNA-[protein]-cysteine S-methyltransferase
MITPSAWTIYASPLGPLTVAAGPGGITDVWFPGAAPRLDAALRRPMREVESQLEEYFAGAHRQFELEVDLRGTPLQQLVWAQLRAIPYAATTSYGELAGRIDEAAYPPGLEPYKRVRLAAAAIGRTPAPIIVPCHRVIGADGSLTGYGGGLERKRALLDLERGVAHPPAPDAAHAHVQLALL